MDIVKVISNLYRTVFVLCSLRFAQKRSPFLHRLMRRKMRGEARFLISPRILLPVSAYTVTSGDWDVFPNFLERPEASAKDYLLLYRFFDVESLFDPKAFLVFLPVIILVIFVSKILGKIFVNSDSEVIELSIMYSFAMIFVNVLMVLSIVPVGLFLIFTIAEYFTDSFLIEIVCYFFLFYFVIWFPFMRILLLPQIPFNSVLEKERPDLFPTDDVRSWSLLQKVRDSMMSILTFSLIALVLLMSFLLKSALDFLI